MSDEIANIDLSESDLPPTDADFWMRIAEFALTFNGYDHWGSFDICAEIGNRWAVTYAEQQALPNSLTDLRTCLFFEQRRWRHFDCEPDEQATRYIHALVEGIRDKVLAGEVD